MHHVRNFRKCQGRIIEKKKDFLASEVLATDIVSGEGENAKEWNVNGEKITFSIVKA